MVNDQQNEPERSGIAGLTPLKSDQNNYDASRDPRTGRPPNPLEAQRLAREHAEKQVEGNIDEDVPTETTTSSQEDLRDSERLERSPVPGSQAPARMASPTSTEDELAAIDALVLEGVAREQAENLVKTHGTNWETLKAAAFASENSNSA